MRLPYFRRLAPEVCATARAQTLGASRGQAGYGLAALTLIGVSRSSLAYMTVIMLSAALDDGYCTDGGRRSAWTGSLCAVIEPTSLDTLTIRAAGARRSSGSIALVTATTPKTVISSTARMSSRDVWLGG